MEGRGEDGEGGKGDWIGSRSLVARADILVGVEMGDFIAFVLALWAGMHSGWTASIRYC